MKEDRSVHEHAPVISARSNLIKLPTAKNSHAIGEFPNKVRNGRRDRFDLNAERADSGHEGRIRRPDQCRCDSDPIQRS